MEAKQFKAESKRLLDLMINSIYTNKEIFLRELISNASDAIDKLYYQSLTDNNLNIFRNDLEIKLTTNKENRTLTIEDNGCGMNKQELENNLGTIAQSGSYLFKNNNEKKDDIDIIGQFGVGFYSAFMVAKKIEVESKKVELEEESSSVRTEGIEVIIPLGDLIDKEAEKLRLEEEIKKLTSEVERATKMLANPGFVAKAPETKINEEKEKLAKYESLLQTAKESLNNLKI